MTQQREQRVHTKNLTEGLGLRKDGRIGIRHPQGWGRRNTRFTDEQWVEWARCVTARHGVITLDLGPNGNPADGPVGQLAEAQIRQMQAIHAALRPTSHTMKPPR